MRIGNAGAQAMQILRLDTRYTESQCGEIIDDTQPPETDPVKQEIAARFRETHR